MEVEASLRYVRLSTKIYCDKLEEYFRLENFPEGFRGPLKTLWRATFLARGPALAHPWATAPNPSLTCLEVLSVNGIYVGFASQVCIKFCAGLKANVASSFLLTATD